MAQASITNGACANGAGTVNCTANDGGITAFNYTSVVDGCTGTGDTATVVFQYTIGPGNTDRYDASVFIDHSGSATGALNGTNCFHDTLDPVSNTATSPGPPYFNFTTDNDACGDIPVNQPSGWIRSSPAITITCADNNNNSIYDVHVCSGWDNNAQNNCTGASQAFPGTPSKCRCTTFDIFSPTAAGFLGMSAESGGLADLSRGRWLALLLGVVAAAMFFAGRRRAMAHAKWPDRAP